MKKVLNYIFGKWDCFDFTMLSLVVILAPIVCATMGYSVLSAFVAIFLVLGTIMVSKDNALGYGAEIVALALFCAALSADNFAGNLLVSAAILIPLMIFKIVTPFVKKLNDNTPIKLWEYGVLAAVLAVAAYPIYLLMISMNSFMAAVGVISILVALVLLFLEVRGVEWAKFIHIAITVLQFVLYIINMYFNDTKEINILFGLALSLILQIYYFSKWLSVYLKARKACKSEQGEPCAK